MHTCTPLNLLMFGKSFMPKRRHAYLYVAMRTDGKIITGKIEFSGINNHKRLNGAHVLRIESPGSDFIMIHTRVKVSKMVIKRR